MLLAAGVLVACAAGVLLLRSVTRDRVDALSAKVHWPACARIARSDRVRWPAARESATVSCEFLGPYFVYARFDDAQALRRAVLQRPPSSGTCIAATEVVLDGLDGADFDTICSAIGGRKVDAVSGLRSLPCTDCDTMAGSDRAADREFARDTRVERRALVRFFGAGR